MLINKRKKATAPGIQDKGGIPKKFGKEVFLRIKEQVKLEEMTKKRKWSSEIFGT